MSSIILRSNWDTEGLGGKTLWGNIGRREPIRGARGLNSFFLEAERRPHPAHTLFWDPFSPPPVSQWVWGPFVMAASVDIHPYILGSLQETGWKHFPMRGEAPPPQGVLPVNYIDGVQFTDIREQTSRTLKPFKSPLCIETSGRGLVHDSKLPDRHNWRFQKLHSLTCRVSLLRSLPQLDMDECFVFIYFFKSIYLFCACVSR